MFICPVLVRTSYNRSDNHCRT